MHANASIKTVDKTVMWSTAIFKIKHVQCS